MFNRAAWAVALITAAVAPAIAGFLDSHAANAAWSRRVDLDAQCAFAGSVRDRLAAIRRTMLPTQPGDPVNVDLTQATAACSDKATPAEVTWLTVGVTYLGLQPKALRYSQSLPAHWRWPSVHAAIGALLPFIALIGAMVLFRRQFFPPGPPPPVATPDLEAATLVDQLIAVAQRAFALRGTDEIDPPMSPFNLSLERRHLMVASQPYHLEDPRLASKSSRVYRYDLLREQTPLAQPRLYGAVLIYNFDTALLGTRTYRIALERLEKLAEQQQTASGRHLHLFLFAASEPLDRILFTETLRQPETDDTTDACPISTRFRWAELLDSVTLYNVAPPAVPAGDTLFRRELSVVGTGAANLMLAQEASWAKIGDEELIPFLTDFLADHYSLVWETSTPDERVILYEIARGSHLKMCDSFALRSLLLRRLVVQAPEYRLMSQSFTRYVRNVGKPSSLRAAANAASDGTDKIWPALRVPAALLVASGLVLLYLVTPGEGGITTMVPALAAAVPAMISAWLRGSRPATG